MSRRRTSAALLLTLAGITGCSMMHGDPKHPKRNPHPVQRYEVIATADAPGPWDSVSGTVFFDVVNEACTPRDEFLGVHAKPQDVSVDFAMTRTSPNTWTGYFYRDGMLDENYYGLGVCHWDATQVAPLFTVHGETFGSGQTLEEALKVPQTDYFKRSEYWDREITGGGALVSSAMNPEVVRYPLDFFSIAVRVRKVTP